MTKRITIDPMTRLEGHGEIDIFLDDDGNVDKAYFQVPELRGFEKFAQGRHAEDMPQIASRICGVCPTAHHMASTKALISDGKFDDGILNMIEMEFGAYDPCHGCATHALSDQMPPSIVCFRGSQHA